MWTNRLCVIGLFSSSRPILRRSDRLVSRSQDPLLSYWKISRRGEFLLEVADPLKSHLNATHANITTLVSVVSELCRPPWALRTLHSGSHHPIIQIQHCIIYFAAANISVVVSLSLSGGGVVSKEAFQNEPL